jgi:predicted HTH domain antitoxin
MDTLKVEVELPRDLLLALNIAPAEIEYKTREWVTLELFREGEISAGKAAEILGLSKSMYMDLLSQRHIPYLGSSARELSQDMGAALAAMNKPLT